MYTSGLAQSIARQVISDPYSYPDSWIPIAFMDIGWDFNVSGNI